MARRQSDAGVFGLAFFAIATFVRVLMMLIRITIIHVRRYRAEKKVNLNRTYDVPSRSFPRQSTGPHPWD